MDTGRGILWPASPAGWQPGHSQREAPRPPGTGPRRAPARVRGKDLLPARQHHGHRPPDVAGPLHRRCPGLLTGRRL